MTGRIPARAAKLAGALVASSTIVALAAGTAGATPTAGLDPSPSAAPSGIHHAKPTTVKFEVAYDAEAYYGAVTCKGKHQTNEMKGFPGNETEGGRDVEKCKSSTGKPLVGLTANETVLLGAGEFPGSSAWESDYFLFVKGGLDVQTTQIEYKVSANDKAFKLVAYYPFAG